jgi:tetratricopeptide (TPR) repeat protein
MAAVYAEKNGERTELLLSRRTASLVLAGRLADAFKPAQKIVGKSNDAEEAESHGEIVDTNPAPLLRRADSYAKQSKWDNAAVDLRRLIKLEPINHLNWWYLTPILLHLGDQEAYRDHCERILDAFEHSADLHAVTLATKACLLAPGALKDEQRLTHMYERAINFGDTSMLGLFEYRRKRYDEAIRRLREQDAVRRYPHVPTQCDLVLAMVYARSGKPELARKTLEAAKQKMQNVPRPDSGNLPASWPDLLICWILRAEAEKVVAGFARESIGK